MSDPTAPLSFRADEIDRAALDQLAAVLDLQAARPGIRRLREWSHAALHVQPGESALDLGSGTGSETRALAEAVTASGRAIGLDPNPGMTFLAQERAAAEGSTAQFVIGDAYSLPFPDQRLDVVRSERVFQHLSEPDRAVAEVVRVLRPGGRGVIVDSDWGTAIMHPGDPLVLQKIMDVMLAHTANPHSGRLLPGQLTAAGLTIEDVGTEALIQDPDDATGPLVQMMAVAAVAEGAITEAERVALLEQLNAAARSGDFHMSVTMFAYLVRKP
ncbi:class I SAM-dependent methyltransferase [Rhodococcus opacus]|uniref:Putative methyltransferase n=1 Tax=Rhodococcus opacus (strain B4) TaxID=632772 RepID=C1B9I9_RHOOB|nr:class I SAM-dependent methyltransferase [Rhodococcus opacus]BAH52342.1 putative methyltransferase [Rhodococcus opacus B4]